MNLVLWQPLPIGWRQPMDKLSKSQTEMMRELTASERQTLEKRRRELNGFVEQTAPLLADFADRLGLQNPDLIANKPDEYLEAINNFMKEQVVTEEDRVWIITRLGYLIGQVLIQKLGGNWLLNERPDSRFFLRYVVGQFPGLRNPNATVDPFNVATIFVAEPPGRSLISIISEAEHEVQKYWDGLGTS